MKRALAMFIVASSLCLITPIWPSLARRMFFCDGPYMGCTTQGCTEDVGICPATNKDYYYTILTGLAAYDCAPGGNGRAPTPPGNYCLVKGFLSVDMFGNRVNLARTTRSRRGAFSEIELHFHLLVRCLGVLRGSRGIRMRLFLFLTLLGAQEPDRTDAVEHLRLSYKANKDAFAFGTFHFDYLVGSADGVEAAEACRLTRSLHEDGFYVFDGRNARYELIPDPAEFAAFATRVSERRTSSLADAFRMLTDGEATLLDSLGANEGVSDFVHSPGIKSMNMFFGNGFFQFPLWIGDQSSHRYCDLDSDLGGVNDGLASIVELNLDSRYEGAQVCKLALKWAKGDRTYWIDLKRGAIPLRIVDHSPPSHTVSVIRFDDLEEVRDRGWFPRRMLHYIGSGDRVEQLVVTKMDTRNKPPLSRFALEFSKPIAMVDELRKFVYSPRRTWSLLDLPRPGSPGARYAPTLDQSLSDKMPGEISPGTPWGLIARAGVALTTLVSAWVFLKARRRRFTGV